MQYLYGSPEEIAFVEKAKKSGHLVDVYDLDRVKAIEGNSLVTPEALTDLDGKYGGDYHNHLIAIFADWQLDKKELIAAYPPLAAHFNSSVYPPIYIFINLITKQILAYKRLSDGDTECYLMPEEDPNPTDQLKEFCRLDYLDIISQLSDAFQDIINEDEEVQEVELDETLIQDALSIGPDKRGFYYLTQFDLEAANQMSEFDFFDDQPEPNFTLTQIKKAQRKLQSLDRKILSSIDIFKAVFTSRHIDGGHFVLDDD